MSELLPAYLARIRMRHPGAPTLEALHALHAAHTATIPFENLDILLGRGISLDVARLREKLVSQRRGGYCFEQNTLLMHVLRDLGYTVSPMEARVRVGATALRPRTHMTLVVHFPGGDWLADVGFGGEGPREPVPMQAGPSDLPDGVEHRVRSEGTLRVLQARTASGWADQYAFVPEPVYPVDFEVANWFTSTHPQSPFVRSLTAQRAAPDVRYVLRYPTYSEIRGTDVITREIARSELPWLLRTVFLIDLPDQTVFPAIDGAAVPG